MSTATGYSLWLVPNVQSELYAELAQCISQTANECGTPNFVPHVTLLGGINHVKEQEALGRSLELANSLTSYEMQLDKLGSNGSYFQILFSKINSTTPVMEANRAAQEVFSMDSGSYFPHLSLAYGDLSPNQVQELQDEILARHGSLVGARFEVREIELWKTEGVVADWKRVKAFPIRS